MGCVDCGCPTSRRQCKQCEILDRMEEDVNRDRDPYRAECPECGDITSGQDVVCASCRSTGGESA